MRLLVIRHGESEADLLNVHEWLIVKDTRCVVKANVSAFDVSTS